MQLHRGSFVATVEPLKWQFFQGAAEKEKEKEANFASGIAIRFFLGTWTCRQSVPGFEFQVSETLTSQVFPALPAPTPVPAPGAFTGVSAARAPSGSAHSSAPDCSLAAAWIFGATMCVECRSAFPLMYASYC